MVLGKDLTSFFCVWVSNFSRTTFEKTALSPLNGLGTFIKNHLTMYERIIFELSILYLWSIFYSIVFMPVPHYFSYNSFVISLKSESVSPLASFFFFKVVVTFQSPFRFHMNFQMGFSIPAQKRSLGP
jgi:hypothetical protein